MSRFTGHRPQKLQKSESEIVSALGRAVDAAASDSSRLIAVYNGTPGGTHNTILAAQKLGVQIVCTFAEGTLASYNER